MVAVFELTAVEIAEVEIRGAVRLYCRDPTRDDGDLDQEGAGTWRPVWILVIF